jgi:hypothetical protein
MVSGKMKNYSQFSILRNGSSDLPSCVFHVSPHWRWSHQNTPDQAFISASGRFFLAMSVLALLLLPAIRAQSKDETPRVTFDEDANYYSKAIADGPVAHLQKRIEQGQANLKYDPTCGYLLSILDELNVPKSSQLLVFSKTSSQRERISPKTPRAIYFNHEVYLGWIPGSPTLELSCVDPKLGAVFYTMEQRETAKPRFTRNDQCLECHTSSRTMGVPGYVVRSFVTDEDGVVDLGHGISLVDHRTPIVARWGGWYVCGTHGSQIHLGNLFGPKAFERQKLEPNYLGTLAELSRFFDTSKYPRPTSDIVALMVLDHQARMQNLITRLNYDGNAALKLEGDASPLRDSALALLKYLLFIEETPLASPIDGPSGFAQWFESQGPTDKQGRSLRQFDLQTRLFKYPCSYMIYSDAFDNLPREVKLMLYHRLWKILSGADFDPAFQQIPEETRRAIREILIETKPDIPRYWTL